MVQGLNPGSDLKMNKSHLYVSLYIVIDRAKQFYPLVDFIAY